MNEVDFFRLYPDCKLVKGAARAAIYDLTRDHLFILDKPYGNLFEDDAFDITEETKRSVDDFEDFLSFLSDEELGEINLSPQFIPISKEYISPSYISNAIIELGNCSDFDFDFLASQLDLLFCECISFRFVETKPIEEISNIIGYFISGSARDIELNLIYQDSLADGKLLESIHLQLPLLSSINIYYSPLDKVELLATGLKVCYTRKGMRCNLQQPDFDYPKYTCVNRTFFQ